SGMPSSDSPIRGLSGVQSSKLDKAITRVYRSLDLERYQGSYRTIADDLALACMDRLIGKGMDREFEAYCERRIAELRQRRRQGGEDQRLEFLSERLQRLQRGKHNPK